MFNDDNNIKYKYNIYNDVIYRYLMMESTEENKVLMEEKNNHIGIGVASN